MRTPQQTLSSAINRASEITWWNRNLTKLTEADEVTNSQEFLENSLIETKGPYVEFVDSPAPAESPATEFLREHGYDEDLIDALVDELFGGDETGRLYQHQAEMIEATVQDTHSNILTVPTATGKTEAFLLPILNDCLQIDEDGTKALIVYPMKTLAVDQFNRLLRYLQLINQSRDREDRVTVGIWDGDTATSVGNGERQIEPGSYVRGLECPQTGRKLTIGDDGVVEAEGRRYPWVKVTRDRVKEGADILLTNPEAMDYAFVNDKADTRGVFGESVGDHPVQHIVFDEAHVWRGIKGAAIRLLVDRLDHFYGPSDPQVSLISATVKNPAPLASGLTGESKSDINVITFSSRDRPAVSSGDIDRLTPATLEDILNTLLRIHVGSPEASEFKSRQPELVNALETCREVGLVSGGNSLEILSSHGWLRDNLEEAIDHALRESSHSTASAAVEDQQTRHVIHEELLEDGGLESDWFDFVVDAVPEVMELAEWFDTDTMGNVEFKHYEELLEYLDDRVSGNPEAYVPTLLGFGRLAGVVTEKYHSFIKPPLKVYWCHDCGHLSRQDVCPDCGVEIQELRFCENCDTPFRVVKSEAASDDSGDSDAAEQLIPLDGSAPAERCPDCGQSLSVSDTEVPTSTLLSFMLTEMCRVTPSEKVLVFSDSHSSAENVAKQIQETEYGLMAATLYVDFLKRQGGSGSRFRAYKYVVQRLRNEYWDPFYDDSLSPSGSAYNMIEQLQDDVVKNADLYNSSFLFDSTLITSDVLYETASDAFELMVGHAVWEVFASSESVDFTKSGITIPALPREKIHGKVRNKLSQTDRDLTRLVDQFIFEFVQAGIIHEERYESVQVEIKNKANSEEAAQEAIEYINQQRAELSQLDTVPDEFQVESGLFIRKHRQDRTDLRLLTHVAFCENCQSAFPAYEDQAPSDTCFECGNPLTVYQRFELDNGQIEGSGYADIDDSNPWPVDHWAHDIMRPLNGTDQIDHVTVGIHKGNIPATVRGIIEEGFRKDDPEINIVSSTPTMELGVDIGTLDTVAQVGIPPTLTNYVQRSGRTGRSRGSSSLVVTAIRGRHPVDNHFYQDLSRFFNEFQPVRVPPAYEFEQLLAGHVVTEVMGHLARNTHQSNVYQRSYAISDGDELTVDTFVAKIREHLGQLQTVITGDREDVLREHISDVFGDEGVRVFENIFWSEGSISMAHRIDEAFEPLREASADTISTDDLSENYGRLDSWLRQLGYLANYRSFGHQFPVTFTGYESSIEFESTGRLYDMFPGEENGRGAVFPMGGRNYLVDDVTAGRELSLLKICTNDDCEWPFQSYETSTEVCPHCAEELTETAIHEVASVHCRPAYKGEGYWNTRGLQTTHVELTPTPDTVEDTDTVFDLDTTVTQGAFNTTEFVYAFERRHASGSGVDILRSEAAIEGRESEYAPVGRQFQATGIEFEFSKADIAARIDEDPEDLPWAVLMVSLEQALQRAVAVTVKVELDDFEVRTNIGDETLSVAVVDGRSGGNGVAWEVAETLHSDVLPELREVIDCDNCHSYCEECLLLPRTPAFYLENDLLDKQLVSAMITPD